MLALFFAVSMTQDPVEKAAAAVVEWKTKLSEALDAAKENQRPIFWLQLVGDLDGKT